MTAINNTNNAMDNARILADGITQCNDTRVTGLNNNDLLIGSTGSGKTRSYVIPNIVHNSGESLVVADTKGNLHKKYGPYLRAQGYEVQVVDFVNCLESPTGYDPLRFIQRKNNSCGYSEQDVMSIAAAFCPIKSKKDPYWDEAARMTLASLIGLTLEHFVESEQSMKTVCYLATRLGSNWLDELFQEVAMTNDESFAVRQRKLTTINAEAEKMVASVNGIMINALQPMMFDGANHLFDAKGQVDFASLGHRKTALFLTVSDNDRALDGLVNLFYTQAIQTLVREADSQESNALPVPVRFILDDFATNTLIPSFDKIITTIRSREISVSLIVQDLTQLTALYGPYVGAVIANNCDTWLYLGGQDVNTAEALSKKLGRTVDTVLSLGLDEVFLMRRGQKPQRVKRYDLSADGLHEAIMAADSSTIEIFEEEELEPSCTA